jgi:DNA-directed RNA polymerase specialized sigma24 family protein
MGATQERGKLVLELFEAFYERVYCHVRKRAPLAQAERIAQEVFIVLLDLEDLEKRSISLGCLIRIARNLLDGGMKRSGQFGRCSKAVNQRHGSSREAMESPRRHALEASALESAMECLTCDERDAMRLIVTDALSYQHAARSLSVPSSPLNDWKHRGQHSIQGFESRGDLRD